MELIGKDIVKIVKSKRKINRKIDLYDLNDVEKNREFYKILESARESVIKKNN